MYDVNSFLPLVALGKPANQPGWADSLTQSSQQNLDNQYIDQLKNYFAQADNYLKTQALQRGSDRGYHAPPFDKPIPQREAVQYDADGNMLPVNRILPVDPNIHAPVLADLPPEQDPGITFGGAHPPADPTMLLQRFMSMMLDRFNQLEALIKSK